MALEAARHDLEAYLRGLEALSDISLGELAPFGDGNSGFTYAVSAEIAGQTSSLVLRLSPPNARIAGPADVGRQGRILSALHEAGAPAPRVLAHDSAPCIDGRAFVLMELVEGARWDTAEAPGTDGEVAAVVVETLKKLQSISQDQIGIGDEPPVSPADELERWARLLDRAVEPVREPGRRLAELLARALPLPSAPCLVHGDFHYGNLLFREGNVVAVLDWEIAERGEPLLDVGCLAVASLRRKYGAEPNPTGSVDVPVEGLLELYGAEPEDAAWFVALTCLKYGAILGYNLGLHRSGKRHDPIYDELQETMRGLMDDGTVILRNGLVGSGLPGAA
jgi:aminoglycoside phosphotransferase (APT) family kinase protein